MHNLAKSMINYNHHLQGIHGWVAILIWIKSR